MSEISNYRVEPLQEIAHLRQCLEIQKLTWGFADEDVLPLRTLIVCTKIGGQVFGAVNAEGTVLGFLNAFPGFRDGQVYLHSQMMAVRPEFQNQGIGKQLKLAQREEALQRGISLIEWTFDPLEIRNARFNIEILGAICRRYSINTYGVTSSHLHGGLPTDRLVAEWHLHSPRVQRQLGMKPLVGRLPAPGAAAEIPLNIGELRSAEPDVALGIQLQLREQMLELMHRKFCVTGFEISPDTQTARYLFHSMDQLDPLS
jgi:predicted GNAT superfamily acetyltransferase